ncbi:MAG: discoidin domain-containing protein, partial [Oscillospiraceae bacterium]
MRKEKIRRRFTSCLCVLLTVTCIWGSALSNGPVNEYKVSAAPAENEVLQDQLLSEDPDVKADPNNLAYGRTYTAAWKCDNAYSDDNNELTNGKRGRLNFRDPEWVGFSAGGGVQENWDGVLYFNWFDQSENCNADFTYVFPEEKTFEQINIAMRKGSPWGNANDGVADHIKIQAEIDGEWVTFYEQEGLHTTAGRDLAIKTADGNPVTATGLKFWFYAWTGNVQAVSLAEIEVLAEATAVDANGDLADPTILTETEIPAVSENLLCGLTPICGIKPIYIANIHHENANDPSSPLKSDVFDVLTDGIIPSVQPPTDFYITVDLGSVQSFEQVKIGSLSNVSDGGIWPINKIKVEYSDNGQNWMAFAEQSLSYPGDAVNRYVTAAESAVSGQYVRIHMETNNWYFIDEIEILQLADTNPDANENPNYGSMLNLVSDDKKYTVSVKADINDKIGILTDGKYGLTYTKDDPNWMGFSTPGHVAINFDLM